MKLPVIDQAQVEGKRVFVRGDIDVPLASGQIVDDTRLNDLWPTIEWLLSKNCQVILAGHLGRPEGKVVTELVVKPVADWFKNKAGDKVRVLENLRFDPREEANSEDFARQLADMADIYVDEAFGACYEGHASIVGVPKFLPHYAGLRLAKEVEVLSGILAYPKRPILVIIGGAKVETKAPVIAKIQNWADRVLVGGKIVTEVFPFARQSGINLNRDKVITFPLTADFKDIFPQAIYDASADFLLAETIVWNGPFGAIEEEKWQVGTDKVIDLILQNKRAFKVVGGGDTVGYLNKLGLASRFDWVSCGGGSMLKFLAGETLPGVEALLV